MNQENRPPMKNDPALAAPKDHPVDRVAHLGGQAALLVGPKAHPAGPKDRLVDRAALLVGPKAHPVDRAGLLVGPRGHLEAQAVLLAGPGDHPAKESSEPEPPPAREQPQVQANGESLFTEMPTKGSSRRALESS